MFGGCASDEGSAKAGSANKNLRVGMTRDAVVALYGKSDDTRVNGEGETWIYYLNVGKQFVPWNLGYSPELRLINFDKAGKVKSWKYSK